MRLALLVVLFWAHCFQTTLPCVQVIDNVMHYTSSFPDLTNKNLTNKLFFQTGNPTLACVIDRYDLTSQPFQHVKIHQNVLAILLVLYMTCFIYSGLRGSTLQILIGIFLTVHIGVIFSVIHSILIVHELTGKINQGVGSCVPVALLYVLLQVLYCLRLPGRDNVIMVLFVTWAYGLTTPTLACTKFLKDTPSFYYRVDTTCPDETTSSVNSKAFSFFLWFMDSIGVAEATDLTRQQNELLSFAITILFLVWLHKTVFKNTNRVLLINIIKETIVYYFVGHSEYPHMLIAVVLAHAVVTPTTLQQNILCFAVAVLGQCTDLYWFTVHRMTLFLPLSAYLYNKQFGRETAYWDPYVFARLFTFLFAHEAPFNDTTQWVFVLDYVCHYYNPTILPTLFNVLPPELVDLVWTACKHGVPTAVILARRILYSMAENCKQFVMIDVRDTNRRIFTGLTHTIHAVTYSIYTLNHVPWNNNHDQQTTSAGALIEAYTIDCVRKPLPSGNQLIRTEVLSMQPNFPHYMQKPTHIMPRLMYITPRLKWFTYVFNLSLACLMRTLVLTITMLPAKVCFVLILIMQFGYSDGLEVGRYYNGTDFLTHVDASTLELTGVLFLLVVVSLYVAHVLKQVRQNYMITIQLAVSTTLMIILPTWGVVISIVINVAMNLINYWYLFNPSLDLIRLMTWLLFVTSLQLSTYSLLWHPIITLYNLAFYHGLAVVIGSTLTLIGFVVILDFKMSQSFNPREILTKDLKTGKIIDRSYQDSLLGYLFFGTTIFATTPAVKAVANALFYSTSDLVDKWMQTHNNPNKVAKELIKNSSQMGAVEQLLDEINEDDMISDFYLSATPKAAIPFCSLGYITSITKQALANAFPIYTNAGPIIVCNYHSVHHEGSTMKEILFTNAKNDAIKCKLVSSDSKSDIAIYKPKEFAGPTFKVGTLQLGQTYLWAGLCPPYTSAEHKFCVPLQLGPYGAHSGIPPSNGDSGSVLINPKNGEICGIKWACATDNEGSLLPINYYLDAAPLAGIRFPKRALASNSLVDKKHEYWEQFITNREASIKEFDEAIESADQSKIDEALKKLHKVIQLGKSMQNEITGKITAEKAGKKLQQHRCDDLNKEVHETMQRIDEKIQMYNMRIENLGEGDERLDDLRAERARLEAELKETVNKINATVKQEHRNEFMDLCRRIGALGAEKAKTRTLLVVAEEGEDILATYRARNKEIQRELDDLLKKVDEYREKFPILANRMPEGVKAVRFPIVYKKDENWHTHLSDNVHIITNTHPSADPTIIKMGQDYGYPKQKLWKKVLQANTTSAEWAQQYLTGAAPNNFLHYIRKLIWWPEVNYEANCPNCGKRFPCNHKSIDEAHTCTKECHQSIVSGISRHLNTCPANHADFTGGTPVYHLGDDCVVPDNGKIRYQGITCGHNHKCIINAKDMRILIDSNPKFKLNQWYCISNSEGPLVYIKRSCVETLRAKSPLVQQKLVSNAHLMSALDDIYHHVDNVGRTVQNLEVSVNSLEFKQMRPSPNQYNQQPQKQAVQTNEPRLTDAMKRKGLNPTASEWLQPQQPAPVQKEQRKTRIQQSPIRANSEDRPQRETSPNRVPYVFISGKYHNDTLKSACGCPRHNGCVEWDNEAKREVGIRDCKCHMCTDQVCIWCNTTGHFTVDCESQKTKSCPECEANCENWFVSGRGAKHHCTCGNVPDQCVVCLGDHHAMACPIVYRTNLTANPARMNYPIDRQWWEKIFHITSNNGQSRAQRKYGNFQGTSLTRSTQPT